jgi:hypothetical protein
LHTVLLEWEQLGIHQVELQKFAGACLHSMNTPPSSNDLRIDASHPTPAPALASGGDPQETLPTAKYAAW